jgi:hypothetical protein
MHLWCRFYVSRPLFAEAQLDALQSVISELLPEWASELHVTKDESSIQKALVGRTGRLFEGLHQVAPPERGLGMAD